MNELKLINKFIILKRQILEHILIFQFIYFKFHIYFSVLHVTLNYFLFINIDTFILLEWVKKNEIQLTAINIHYIYIVFLIKLCLITFL